MECPPIRAEAWLEEHEADLIGLEEADAVALVEGAGLHARVIAPGPGWMTQEQRRDRIDLWRSAEGPIASASAG
ncbi:hypothetical protein [Amnibacterium kyonggiense]|uniref:Uncharacterized protein n=1 Tax=Amnibacterium kyonggiense TaxID=595671 RepID=A0A4R7FSQ3_9MICO|nr:hypothetical protein [Amnibacterium kyonggiense]TDS80902.1 hypothetical protein CLV52_1473 [Amnibacterium kyonggiense]